MRSEEASVVGRVLQLLENDPRVDARAHPLTLALRDGTLTIEGELADVAAMTRAVEIAQILPEVRRVEDRLVVAAPIEMGDAELRDRFGRALSGETAFDDCRIVVWAEDVADIIRAPARRRGTIVASVEDGIVTIDGEAPSLAHRRLAGLLAWWIPGTRAVRNDLRVIPAEEDCDEEISDAVRIALEMDPLVDGAQIAVHTAGSRVTLTGTLTSEAQRRIAERDAWYVFGVVDVDNRIEVA